MVILEQFIENTKNIKKYGLDELAAEFNLTESQARRIVYVKDERKMMKKIPNRRPSLTEDVGMGISVTVSFHPETNEAVEIFVTSRGKASDNPMQKKGRHFTISECKFQR